MRLFTKVALIHFCAVTLIAAVTLSASEGQSVETMKSAGPQLVVKSTRDNLLAAFNGESNAHARYVAFAKKADEEGYGQVASLFRAAARAEEIHANNHAKVIRKLGGDPKPELQAPVVKSTRENLEAALAGETYERDTMYPAFLKVARKDKNKDAIRTLVLARTAEGTHAKLYKEALDNLDAWKGGTKNFSVCSVCGYTTTQLDFAKCPACYSPKDKFETIK